MTSKTRSRGPGQGIFFVACALALAGGSIAFAQQGGGAPVGPTREYVPLVPEVKEGALPRVAARALTFDPNTGQGSIPIEIMPVGFWKSRQALAETDYDVYEFSVEAPVHLPDVGKPSVPVQVIQIDIPPETKDEDVVVTLEAELMKTLENVDLIPNQEPLPIGEDDLILETPALTIDKEVYAQETPFPGIFHELIFIGYYGSRKIAVIRTCPTQFNPAKRQVNFYKLTGALTFKAKEIRKAPAPRPLLEEGAGDRSMGPLNLEEASGWEGYRRDVGPELLAGFAATGLPDDVLASGFATLPSVIICADLFLAPAKDLASHRTKNKIPTIVVREKLIERCIPGVDAPDKIRNYIKILHRNFRTNWILLFGDVGTRSCGTFIDVPTRMAVDPVPYSGVDDGWIPCDYYYACLDGTWDGNNNRRYGEAADKPDLLPEVWVGRIPANDLDVAQSIVSAIIAYETKVPAAKGFLLAANDLGWGCHELTFKEKTYLPLAQACGTPSIKRLYQKWNNLSASTLAAAVNGGVDFIEYYGHGSPTSTQVMSAAQVGTLLKRTPSYPAVFALSCSTSRYDANECFGEAWVEGLKASAYIGSARVAYGSQSGGEGLDVRFIQAYRFSRSCGLSLAVAKAQLFTSFGYGADTLKTILEFTLLGDPVMLHRVK